MAERLQAIQDALDAALIYNDATPVTYTSLSDRLDSIEFRLPQG